MGPPVQPFAQDISVWTAIAVVVMILTVVTAFAIVLAWLTRD